MKKKFVCMLSAFLWANWILANGVAPPPFEIGHPEIRGSGCLTGTASAVIKYGGLVEIKVSDFKVTSNNASSLSRKNCGLVIPVSVNSGYSVALPDIKLVGSVLLHDRARASLDVEVFFAGETHPRFKKEFFKDEKFNFVSLTPSQWSTCGQPVNLRVDINLLSRSLENNGSAQLVLSEWNVLPLRWKKC